MTTRRTVGQRPTTITPSRTPSSPPSRSRLAAVFVALGLLASLLGLATSASPAGADEVFMEPTVVSGTEPQWQAVAVASSSPADNTSNHSCAATTVGGVKCWGNGLHGQVGDGDNEANNSTPNDVKLSTAQGTPTVPTTSTAGPVVAVSGTHSCAIVNTPSLTGAVQCWGANGRGQLGDGTTTERLTPVYVLKGDGPGSTYLTGVTSLAAGGEVDGDSFLHGQTCAIADGSAYCWGYGADGRLGNGTTTDKSVPTQVTGLTSGVTAISAGATHSCAVVSGGVKCWGANGSGQLGDNTLTTRTSPVNVRNSANSADLASIQTVAASGGSSTCALTDGGGVQCWGGNTAGQLGNGTTTDTKLPIQVTGLTSGVSSLAIGYRTTCAALSDHSLKCWGANGYGQVGDATTTQRNVPTVVKDVGGSGSLARVSDRRGAVAVGSYTTCTVLSGGTVACWGRGTSGNLGFGLTADRSTPVYVNGTKLPTSWKAAEIAAFLYDLDEGSGSGVRTACATSTAGDVRCWGGDQYDIVNPAGGVDDTNAPTLHTLNSAAGGANPVAVVDDSTGPHLSVGNYHACAVVNSATLTGSVQCWGDNGSGQLGNGGATVPATGQVVVQGQGPGTGGRLTGVTSVAAGSGDPGLTNGTSCAVADGGLFCWGEASGGRLGTGSSTNRNTPGQVLPVGSGATQVALGPLSGCAIVGGGVKCWGDNSSGQLGDNTNTTRSTPVNVQLASGGLLSGATSVSVGRKHACAVASGAVYCWGNNGNGRLGDGTTTNRSRAVPVTGLGSGATSVQAGGSHTCAVVSGAARCWGSNASGQLGDGTLTQRTSSVPVVGIGAAGALTGLSSAPAGVLASSNVSTCSIQANGRATCWGTEGPSLDFGHGMLSPWSSSDNNLPVATDQSGISVSANHSVAIDLAVTDADRWTNAISAGAGGDESPTVTLVQPAVGTVTCGAFVPSGPSAGTFPCTYAVPAGTPSDTFSFQYTAHDSHGGDASGTITGSIGQVDPVADDQSVSASRGVGQHIVLTATDPNGDTLGYQIVDPPSKGTIDCNGAYGEDCTYTAGPGQTGTDSFTFKVSDGVYDSNTATVSITITNQAPTGDAIAASAPRGVATEVVLTGVDPNSDPITFTVVDQPTKGDVTCTTAGICSYTADPGTSGTDTFTFRVNDGALDSASTATATITITNQAPIADARTLDAGKTVPTPVTLSGSDVNGDALTFAVVDQPAKGTVSCTGPTGADCTYTSTAGQSGTDSFTYVADDGDLDSDPVAVEITLLNTPPSANDQSVDAPRGVATPITLAGTDDNGDSSTFTVADQPTKGLLSCAGAGNADCTYTAGAGQTGTDSFTYRANDGEADSALATVTITITNQDPTANAQTVLANAPLSGTPITLTGSDPNGDSLTYDVVGSPNKGVLSCTADSCTYTAAAGKTGTDSFTFRVDDGFGGTSSTATVTVTLDGTTPGVYIGDAEMLEPETDPNKVLSGPMVPVTLSRPSAQAVTVWYWTSDGTAQAQGIGTGDYRTWGTPTQPLSVTIPAGKLQTAIAPPVHGDNLVEPTETFQVHVIAVTGGANYLGQATGNVRIIDTDTVSNGDPVLNLSGAGQTEGNNGNRVVQFRIHLSRPAASPVKVSYATVAGTALAGTDFKATSGSLTFATGETSKTVDVLLYPNTDVNALTRSLSLQMNVVSGPSLNVQATTATATLRDED